MSFIQLLVAAASLSAAAGGTWGVERVLDRYARISEAPAPAEESVGDEEEEEESRLLY